MITNVEVKVSIDIEDIYNELSWDEKEEFLKSHINDLGGISDVVEQCFNDADIEYFVENYIDKVSDEALMQEVKNRG